MAAVDAKLLEVFRSLVSGKAAWPLYLWGPAGTGKTSAALALLDHCGPLPIEGNRPDVVTEWIAGFVDVRTIPRVRIAADKGQLDWSRDGLAGTFTWEILLGAVSRAPLVVFDEIGVGREAGDFKLDVMLELLDRRAVNPVKPFIVTANLAPGDIAKVYDTRVASRVLGTAFKLDGADRRITLPGATASRPRSVSTTTMRPVPTTN